MNVPNSQGRQGGRWRPPQLITRFALAAFMMTILALTGTSQAAEFDEKLKAPMMKGQAELQTQVRPLATRYRELWRNAPEQLIRNATLARQQFDLRWQVQRAIDAHQPLDELAVVGIVSQGDGSYGIDLAEYPEWNDLHETMAGLISRADMAEVGPILISRGFRPEDVATLKEYITTRNPDTAASLDMLPITLGFARVVRKYDRLKLSVPDSVVMSFLYQRARSNSESNRRWVEGLLARLDAQRARIVMSTFTELKPTTRWIPENLQQGIAEYLAMVRQPNFEARAIAEAKGDAP